MSQLEDRTISGYALVSGSELAQRLLALREGMAPRQMSYFLNGDDHVTLDLKPWPTNTSGLSMGAWVQQFLDDDPAWTHSGP